jgi:HEAT repeat protein
MLEQLESLPWSTLIHAYGSAFDVPQQIRALASEDRDTREHALRKLYGNIFHQGTRYQATPYAIPFFYELLGTPSTPDKNDIIYLLVSLALGYEEYYLPDGLDPVAFRCNLTESQQQISADDRAACAEYGYGPRIDIDCYDAVRQGVSTLIRFLDDDDPQVRSAAAYVLAWFPEDSATSLPRLLRLLDQETEHVTLATLILTIGLLARASTVSLDVGKLDSFLFHQSLLIRVAAAIGLAREPLERRIIDILIEAILAPEQLQAAIAVMPLDVLFFAVPDLQPAVLVPSPVALAPPATESAALLR